MQENEQVDNIKAREERSALWNHLTVNSTFQSQGSMANKL